VLTEYRAKQTAPAPRIVAPPSDGRKKEVTNPPTPETKAPDVILPKVDAITLEPKVLPDALPESSTRWIWAVVLLAIAGLLTFLIMRQRNGRLQR
jgi:hypothetical protein